MAATTITRATITDDSGSGTDGTIINSAWVGTAIYDKIDALFSAAGDTNKIFDASTNAVNALCIRNQNNGAAAAGALLVGNDVTDRVLAIYGRSTGFTPSGMTLAAGVDLVASGVGGMAIIASNAAGTLRFAAGGATEQMRLTAAGHVVLAEQTTNPGTGDLAADAAIAVYTKADKLVFAYNNGGTVTYITLDLDGSDTTWAHSTSAP